jgi:ubiquinol-cytochrome c reductase cytochrome c1 subunit
MAMMSKLKALAGALALVLTVGGAAFAAGAEGGEAGHTPHYPINKPRHVDWSFGGPFGHYDEQQLQRGLKVYKEVCSSCHAIKRVAFRTLEDLGYSEEQVKAFAAEYTVMDGPNSDGEMFERPALPSDKWPAPYPNKEAAQASNNGAYPPDFSLLAKARAVERGLPWFIFDIFTMYAELGPDYIYSLLTGYTDAPEGVEVAEGTYYNPYYKGGPALAMPNILSDDLVTYDDGTPATVDQMAQDVAAFMMWAAEPKLEERKETGFRVMVFLALFAGMVYLVKRRIFASVAH